MQNKRERTNQTENKKLNEIFDFVKSLKDTNYNEKEFNKQIILFFGVSDFRVVAGKTKLMETLDLIEFKTNSWGDRVIWIKETL